MKKENNELDMVEYPPHYTSHPAGIECIEVVEHMNFCLGNAIKYIWRVDEKENAIEDLKKALWYITREIDRRQEENRRESRRKQIDTGREEYLKRQKKSNQ